MFFIFVIIIYGLIFGSLCAWIAAQKERDTTNWFILGALLGILALIALAAIPSLENKILQSKDPARLKQFQGNEDVNSDDYQLFLVENYKIIKNEVLGRYSISGKSFDDLKSVLAFAVELHKKEANNSIDQEVKTENRKNFNSVEPLLKKIENNQLDGEEIKFIFEKGLGVKVDVVTSVFGGISRYSFSYGGDEWHLTHYEDVIAFFKGRYK